MLNPRVRVLVHRERLGCARQAFDSCSSKLYLAQDTISSQVLAVNAGSRGVGRLRRSEAPSSWGEILNLFSDRLESVLHDKRDAA
jgi:hypothetical protein